MRPMRNALSMMVVVAVLLASRPAAVQQRTTLPVFTADALFTLLPAKATNQVHESADSDLQTRNVRWR